MENFGKYLKIILNEMCKRVNVNYEDINFKKHDWYLEYSWNKEEEKSFENWLDDYLYDNTKARREILSANIKRRKYTKKAASEFVWMYGWKTKEE